MVATGALVGGIIGGVILGIIIGLVAGWYFSVKAFKKQIREKPPVTESQIRFLYSQIGRKPTEKQVKQILNQMKKQN